jgi:hypothetical protein
MGRPLRRLSRLQDPSRGCNIADPSSVSRRQWWTSSSRCTSRTFTWVRFTNSSCPLKRTIHFETPAENAPQNVWPLIYKPLFNPHVTSAPLLLSMLAIAACVAPSATKDGFDGHKLFRMAESSLHHCRMESRVDIVQAMILMSLRQTGNGDKGSAFLYAGRACTMVLNLGLNLAPSVAPDSAVRLTRSSSRHISLARWRVGALHR